MESMFFQHFAFDGESIRLTIASNDGLSKLLIIKYVRSFLFFKESDFHIQISKYRKSAMVHNAPDASVFRIEEGAILSHLQPSSLDEEGVMHFGIWTPDECFEVACFEEPLITSTNAAAK